MVPECRLPLTAAPLHTAAAGKLSLPSTATSPPFLAFRPPSVSLFFLLPFCSSTSFFISTLQAAPFQSIISSTPAPALGEGGGWRAVGGKHAKRCGIYLSFLAPVAGFHKALWPFSFTPSSLIPVPSSCLLSLPSNVFFFLKKGHSGLSSEPVPVLAFLLLLLLSFSFPCVLLTWAELVGGTQSSQVDKGACASLCPRLPRSP